MRHIITLALVAALLPASASALEPKDSKDPNRMICEKQGVLGSRLATKRVCKTAAEWEAQRLAERQTVDRTQVQRQGPNGN